MSAPNAHTIAAHASVGIGHLMQQSTVRPHLLHARVGAHKRVCAVPVGTKGLLGMRARRYCTPDTQAPCDRELLPNPSKLTRGARSNLPTKSESHSSVRKKVGCIIFLDPASYNACGLHRVVKQNTRVCDTCFYGVHDEFAYRNSEKVCIRS